ncbi:universal stress protein [Halalkalibaculum sp. DA384]|uniref:universal stress protein n=1 Tax=Halalkalibaculum sp. DA384 TaxID=3373606 RepID=UPI0037540852
MMEIKKILVPTDFSDEAISAYTHAQELASKLGARVDMIHIVPTLKYFSESINKLGVPLNFDEDLYPHVKDGAQHRLKGFMADYLKEENKGDALVRIERKPSKAIAEFASDNGYDLVVMAARGEHSSDLLRGSITEKVIRYSAVPVFTVDNRLKPEGIKNILLPTDASSLSFACLPVALALADTYGARITLFHVLELYGTLSESLERNPGNTEESDLYQAILEKLTEYLSETGQDGITVQRGDREFEDQILITEGVNPKAIQLNTVIAKGLSAHYEIENYAPDNADLIVMTTHGHSGLAHFFLGSTTEKVAQHVDMPVLTVKPAGKELKKAD